MLLKHLCLVLILCAGAHRSQGNEDDITDFSFESDSASEADLGEEYPDLFNDVDLQDDPEGSENEVELEDSSSLSNKLPLLAGREELVRQQLLTSMRSSDMRGQVAKVLPILRVMTPDQKLALATLVTTQLLSPPNKQLTLDQVINNQSNCFCGFKL